MSPSKLPLPKINFTNLNFGKKFHNTPSITSDKCRVSPGIPPPATIGHHKIYKNLALYVMFPIIAISALYTYNAHMSREECHERPPFVKYEYMRMRSKRFPWGDGQKSLFHNPKVNALPDGYEDEEE
ncbi:unnamed protein product [Callosobruchus maculatus]|uniref:Cytochrome c oxidase polypeptide VIa n=1 Tax=Callosobruchus maculatus TaxID=64391 RepID=A0A653CEH2_CALMS|nr:unnamed protein product [Callosobruchus maculatus]